MSTKNTILLPCISLRMVRPLLMRSVEMVVFMTSLTWNIYANIFRKLNVSFKSVCP